LVNRTEHPIDVVFDAVVAFDMTPNVSLIAAFLAGTLSITSPCVLPLIPLFLAHLAGSTEPGEIARRRPAMMINALAYVAGFSLVFILIGIAIGAAGSLVSTAEIVSSNRFWLVRLGGVVLILLGLHQIGLIHLPLLDRERRLHVDVPSGSRTVSSFLVGVTFAAGWSPCAGPVLGAILTMAAGEANVTRAAILLAVYSAGLAIPFLLMAFVGASSRMLRSIGPRVETITSLSGAIMLATGALMLLGIYQQFFTRLVAAAPWTPWEPSV
jgi:cytochrome c-type biogenesis protein